MTEATKLVWRRSVVLWFLSGLVVWFNAIAAMVGGAAMAYAALAATALIAATGIGFGIWAGVTLAKPPPSRA